MDNVTMQSRDTELVFSPSDLSAYPACEHLTQLERRVALGLADAPAEQENPHADLLREKGIAHEDAELPRYRERGLTIAEIELEPDYDWEHAARETADVLAAGVDVYERVFVADGRRGSPTSRAASRAVLRDRRREGSPGTHSAPLRRVCVACQS